MKADRKVGKLPNSTNASAYGERPRQRFLDPPAISLHDFARERPRRFTDVPAVSLHDLAAMLDLPYSTLEKLRQRGEGPQTFALGRRLYARPRDVAEWIDRVAAEANGQAPPFANVGAGRVALGNPAACRRRRVLSYRPASPAHAAPPGDPTLRCRPGRTPRPFYRGRRDYSGGSAANRVN